MAEGSSNNLIKGYVYLMVVLAAVAGGAAYYLNSVHMNSRKALVADAPRVVQRAYETKEYLTPSVGKYFEYRKDGTIIDVDKSEFASTEEKMDALAREIGLTSENGFVVKAERPRETRDKNAPLRHVVKVSINSCTKVQWQRLMELARQRFGTYAVLENFRIEAATRVNEQKELTGSIDDAGFKYRVTLDYVWYVAPESAAPTAPTA